MPSTYKKTTTTEERMLKSYKMKSLYPDRIPVIIEMSPSSASYNDYTRSSPKIKYLVPPDITMGQFIKIFRDKIKIDASKALFFFINNKLFPMSSLLGTIYESHKDEDGFLYIEFCEESTFGTPSYL
jgi:GABA(A) receptor-associated protein